jgi:hypothetical protein
MTEDEKRGQRLEILSFITFLYARDIMLVEVKEGVVGKIMSSTQMLREYQAEEAENEN